MTISDTTENAILALIFNATAWANYADNAASNPQTYIAVSLNASDPGDTGTMATSEISYVGYARVTVLRNTGGWTISGTSPTSASPVANIDFPAGTGGGSPDVSVAAAFCVGKTTTGLSPDVTQSPDISSGATTILFSGSVSPSITTGNGITPRLTTASHIDLD